MDPSEHSRVDELVAGNSCGSGPHPIRTDRATGTAAGRYWGAADGLDAAAAAGGPHRIEACCCSGVVAAANAMTVAVSVVSRMEFRSISIGEFTIDRTG